MIDWEAFAERVPLGVAVRALEDDPLDEGIELTPCDAGFLMRYGREDADSDGGIYWLDELFVQFERLDDEWPMHPTQLDYLIDGQWLTYEQVMA